MKALKSELHTMKTAHGLSDNAVKALQKALVDMGVTHGRDVDALKVKFAQEMTKAITG